MSEQPTSRSRRLRRPRWPLVVLGAVAIGTVAAVQSTDWLRSFGAQPTGDRLTRMQRSPRYRDGAFENAVPTRKSLPGSFRRTLKLQFTGDQQRVPPSAIPIVAGTRETYATPPASGLRVTGLGHPMTLRSPRHAGSARSTSRSYGPGSPLNRRHFHRIRHGGRRSDDRARAGARRHHGR